MDLYQKIIEATNDQDKKWINAEYKEYSKREIDFGKYSLTVAGKFSKENFPENSFYILDKNLNLNFGFNSRQLLASEKETKNIDFINSFIEKEKNNLNKKILVAVGGGVILDTALCIACILKLKIIFVPTTILSMSDSSIGSKARANKISIKNGESVFIKHFFRQYYDPIEIYICENFLETIPENLILFSCAEIIKHAMFQSESLFNYLLSDNFNPKNDKYSLLKAIIWTADLKRICMQIDPNETVNGSKKIIREGHEFADKLEKESGFNISHGEAVLRGIEKDLLEDGNEERKNLFFKLCAKLK